MIVVIVRTLRGVVNLIFPQPFAIVRRWGGLILCLCASASGAAWQSDSANDSKSEAYFETQVRPLLIAHCVECHGKDESAGELRLDRRTALTKGGASGPTIVPGDAAASRLIRAVEYDDATLQMPPTGKLAEDQVRVLTDWVNAGAYWPEDGTPEQESSLPPAQRIDELRESHWAYRPLQPQQPPTVSDISWPRGPLDHFVLARLEQEGLSPSRRADRRTLILRAYFTLLGLPPSYEEVKAFEEDLAPDAFEKLVDRLLESRHFGERWARHWLDIARYADTTGYFPGSRDTRYPYAYTYRDYVIKAFNDDKPFDRFIIEQLAADQLSLEPSEQESLAAMGFLTVGRRFMGRQHDIIDDRIDVVTRGFLGLSVACARCHDHKYDPIPTADYYSLYGVFASSYEPEELPLLGDSSAAPEYQEFLAAKAEKEREVDQWLEERRLATEEELRSRVADYLVYFADTLPQYDAGNVPKSGPRGTLRPPAIARWQQYLRSHEGAGHPVWSLWHAMSVTKKEEFASRLAHLLQSDSELAAIGGAHPGILTRLRAQPPQTMADLARTIGAELENVHSKWREMRKADPTVASLADPDEELLRGILYASDAPTTLDLGQLHTHLDQAERNTYNTKLGTVKGVEVSHPGAPGRGMVLRDHAQPHQPVIFRRGQPENRGDAVPRRFLQILSHVDGGEPFANGSGRLELAKAIASEKNPLTPRVLVNRVWQQHFGKGLVSTASDFGFRGERPSHPELLDYLAAQFVADGWSIKQLQRRIMLSATWQQASDDREEASRKDPENRYLWRMARKRLEFEPFRDRLLATAGNLDPQIGGRSVKIHELAVRRGLYAYIDREDVPGLLASFDLPSPDASQATRSQTTVPQQALYLLNSRFVIRQAELLARRTVDKQSRDERVIELYRRALARDPDPAELEQASQFLDPSSPFFSGSADEEPSAFPWQFGYGGVDASTNQVLFQRLPHFTGQHWQGSERFPDPVLSYLRLTADGGHPGNDPSHSTLVRWTAPGNGRVSLQGVLKHPASQGDGVHGQIASSRQGMLGSWEVFHGEMTTSVSAVEVVAGETLDFIVDCRRSPDFDSYHWAPVIEVLEGSPGGLAGGMRWNVAADFKSSSAGHVPEKSLDLWVQLAQVLLACNEFVFVD